MSKEFDLHGHTREGSWWEFVNYDIDSAIRQAKEVGLDGIAITQHWSLVGIDYALNQAEKEGVVVVPGVELSARVGIQAPHIIALGITPEEMHLSHSKLPFLKSPQHTISWIHDHGGVAIAPHPALFPNHIALGHEQVKSLGSQLDGIETVTTWGTNSDMATFAYEQGIASIGSSDFHMLAQIGIAVTQMPDSVATWQDVIKCIKANETQAFLKIELPEQSTRTRNIRVLLRQLMGSHV